MPSQYNGQPGTVSSTLPTPKNIIASSNSTPIGVFTATPHLLTSGDYVQINGHLLNVSANGLWQVQVVSATEYLLVGSAGVAIGGTSGTMQSMGYGTTFQIPSDGDPPAAATVNVGLEASGDRTAFDALNTGRYRLLGVLETHLDDDATENTTWASCTISSPNTWTVVTGGTIVTRTSTFNAGDFVDVSFTGSCLWAESTGDGVMLSLWAQWSDPAGGSPTLAKMVGSGQVVATAGGPTSGQAGVNLSGFAIAPAGAGTQQNLSILLYGYSRASSANFTMKGDWVSVVRMWRATGFQGRSA